MARHWRFHIALLIGALSLTARVCADAIVVSKAMTASTIAEVFVEQGAIRAAIEIGVQDLNGFRNLMPDELYERLGHDPVPLVDRAV